MGERAFNALEVHQRKTEELYQVPASAAQITGVVQLLLMKLEQWQQAGQIGKVWLFYNRHQGPHTYLSHGFELLPINLHRFTHLEEQAWPSRGLPTYKMDSEVLLRRLLHQYLFVCLFRACAESQSSEHASRLAAMQAAEHNLDERLEQVQQEFRRARQAQITAELLDVITGFESLTGEAD